jgi:uncharacterized OB-fold protein
MNMQPTIQTKRKPTPQALPTTQPYWDAAQREELHFQRCSDCQLAFLYPRICCPRCGSAAVRWERASGRAILFSYVINYLPAPGFEGEAPHVIAIVQLEEGPRLLSNIIGVEPIPENLPLDMALQVAFEHRSGQNVPVFRPSGANA